MTDETLSTPSRQDVNLLKVAKQTGKVVANKIERHKQHDVHMPSSRYWNLLLFWEEELYKKGSKFKQYASTVETLCTSYFAGSGSDPSRFKDITNIEFLHNLETLYNELETKNTYARFTETLHVGLLTYFGITIVDAIEIEYETYMNTLRLARDQLLLVTPSTVRALKATTSDTITSTQRLRNESWMSGQTKLHKLRERIRKKHTKSRSHEEALRRNADFLRDVFNTIPPGPGNSDDPDSDDPDFVLEGGFDEIAVPKTEHKRDHTATMFVTAWPPPNEIQSTIDSAVNIVSHKQWENKSYICIFVNGSTINIGRVNNGNELAEYKQCNATPPSKENDEFYWALMHMMKSYEGTIRVLLAGSPTHVSATASHGDEFNFFPKDNIVLVESICSIGQMEQITEHAKKPETEGDLSEDASNPGQVILYEIMRAMKKNIERKWVIACGNESLPDYCCTASTYKTNNLPLELQKSMDQYSFEIVSSDDIDLMGNYCKDTTLRTLNENDKIKYRALEGRLIPEEGAQGTMMLVTSGFTPFKSLSRRVKQAEDWIASLSQVSVFVWDIKGNLLTHSRVGLDKLFIQDLKRTIEYSKYIVTNEQFFLTGTTPLTNGTLTENRLTTDMINITMVRKFVPGSYVRNKETNDFGKLVETEYRCSGPTLKLTKYWKVHVPGHVADQSWENYVLEHSTKQLFETSCPDRKP